MTGGRAVVIETYNLLDVRNPDEDLVDLLALLRPQLTHDDDVVVTDPGLAATLRAHALRELPTLRFVAVPAKATYYAHKNLGFAATTAPIVAFVDGDCRPSSGWLNALTEPLLAGAKVAAGPTGYPTGVFAAAATAIDFPLVRTRNGQGVNFFANNVAFVREVFAAHLFPDTPGMEKGACQLVALQLRQAGIGLAIAANATLQHAWPEDAGTLLAMRLGRGRDARQLAPALAREYVPRLATPLARFPRTLGLALLALRAGGGLATLLASRPRPLAGLAGAGFIAAASAVDAVGVFRS